MTTTSAKSRANTGVPHLVVDGELIKGPLGIELHVKAFGNPGAMHKILCIHGGLQALHCFREQYDALVDHDCYLVAFDLPWHGQSGPSLKQQDCTPTAELWAECVHTVRQHFGLLEQPIILLSWSLGGLIARDYLELKGTEGIAGLILVATLLDFNEFAPRAMREMPETLEFLGRLTAAQLPTGERHAALLEFVDRLWWKAPSERQYYETLGYNAKSFFAAGPILDRILATQAPGDTQALLCRLRCPVLLVQGLNDALVMPSYTRQFAELLSPEQMTILELPGCGHSPFLEQPGQFNRAVIEFLHSAVRGPGGHHA